MVDNLSRFIEAQNSCYEEVLRELALGKKMTHWIWYIFPQLRGLGFSESSIYFGLDGLCEAKLYWSNPILKSRYEECLVLLLRGANKVVDVMGKVDSKKLKSSITLFLEVDSNSDLLKEAIKVLYYRKLDAKTLGILGINKPLFIH